MSRDIDTRISRCKEMAKHAVLLPDMLPIFSRHLTTERHCFRVGLLLRRSQCKETHVRERPSASRQPFHEAWRHGSSIRSRSRLRIDHALRRSV